MKLDILFTDEAAAAQGIQIDAISARQTDSDETVSIAGENVLHTDDDGWLNYVL